MSKHTKLLRKARDYEAVLAQTASYREAWDRELRATIEAALKDLAEVAGLTAAVEIREDIGNLAAVTLSLGNVRSGMAQEVVSGVRRELIKHNGSLTYQQLFNGKVVVMVQYPFIENYGEPQPPKTLGIFRPEELKPPFFERHLEELLAEVTKWEDYDDDEPHKQIGFKLNFEQPPLEDPAPKA